MVWNPNLNYFWCGLDQIPQLWNIRGVHHNHPLIFRDLRIWSAIWPGCRCRLRVSITKHSHWPGRYNPSKGNWCIQAMECHHWAWGHHGLYISIKVHKYVVFNLRRGCQNYFVTTLIGYLDKFEIDIGLYSFSSSLSSSLTYKIKLKNLFLPWNGNFSKLQLKLNYLAKLVPPWFPPKQLTQLLEANFMKTPTLRWVMYACTASLSRPWAWLGKSLVMVKHRHRRNVMSYRFKSLFKQFSLLWLFSLL